MSRSILQDWVTGTGLRHQGVLVSAVRGCDDEPRNSCTKMLIRCLRETILVCHCGDSAKADEDSFAREAMATNGMPVANEVRILHEGGGA